MKVTANEYRFLLEGDKNVLKLIVIMAVQLCKYTKNHYIVHFKWVSFMWIIAQQSFFFFLFKQTLESTGGWSRGMWQADRYNTHKGGGRDRAFSAPDIGFLAVQVLKKGEKELHLQ